MTFRPRRARVGACCLLACQSVASIEHALAHGAGNDTQNRTAVSILWNNTASKLVFRSTDHKTSEAVSDQCPYRPGVAGSAPDWIGHPTAARVHRPHRRASRRGTRCVLVRGCPWCHDVPGGRSVGSGGVAASLAVSLA